VHVVYQLVRPRGGVAHLEWTGRFDGRDYPVHGVEEVVSYAYRPAGPRAYDIVTKLDGRASAVSRAELSPDGRSITTRTSGTDASGRFVTTVTVYVKRAS
jgi:hypothetical protein